MKNSFLGVLGGCVLVLVGCGEKLVREPGVPNVEAGRRLFLGNSCASCHGETGKADSVIAGNLNPKPRDYSDAAWQDSVTDEHIAKVIREGGSSVGLSNLMPMTSRLDAGELADLVAFIRSLRDG